MLQLAASGGGSPAHQGTVSDRNSNTRVLTCLTQNRRRANRRPRLSKRRLVRIHDAKVKETKVDHGPRCRSQIERIARVNQDHAEMVGLGNVNQAATILTIQAALPWSLVSTTRVT